MIIIKSLIRGIIFSYIALYTTQIIIGGFLFIDAKNITLLVVLGALTLLNVFLTPLLSLLSLPSNGPLGIFLRFILNLILFYLMSIIVPDFSIVGANISGLNILGVVLPSKSLTPTWSLVFSTLLFVIIYVFFNWLTTNSKKK